MSLSNRRGVVIALALMLFAAACTAPPTQPGQPQGTIQVSGSPVWVNSPEVPMSFTWSPGTTQMRFANGLDPSVSVWQPVVSTATWTLSPGDGPKTIAVQYADGSGAVSPVYTTTVSLDTTPPTIFVQGSSEGQVVDLSSGEIFSLSGTAADDGSGLLGVSVENDGEQAPAITQDGRWAHPVAATQSGLESYRATAIDVAGNTAAVDRSLHMVLPPQDQTIVRPDVLTVEGTVAAALVDDGEDGTSLVFDGDQRPALGAAGVLVSAPMDASPEGLMRRVSSVTYDGGADQTLVATEYATLLDVFAQLRVDTLVPAGGGQRSPDKQAATTSDCEHFADDRTIGGTFELPSMGGSFPFPPLGPSNFSAGVGADIELAAFFDLDIDIGWSGLGPDLRSFKATAGVLLCGEFHASAEVGVSELLGPQFEIGIPYSDAEASLGLKNPTGLTPGWAPLRNGNLLDPVLPPLVSNPTIRGIPLAPTLPIPLYWAPTLKLAPIFDGSISADLSLNGESSIGAEVGIDGTAPFFNPMGNAALTNPSASATAELSAGLGLEGGVKVGEAVLGAGTGSAKLFETGVAVSSKLEPRWQGDIVKVDSWVSSLRGSICPELQASAGLSLTVSFASPWNVGPIQPRLELNILDVEAASIDIPLGSCLFDHTWDWSTPTIINDGLPDGVQGEPYSARIGSTAPATWTVISGAVPTGLALDSGGNLTGTPTAAGTYEFGVRAEFANGTSGESQFIVGIAEPPGGANGPVVDLAAGMKYSCSLHDSGAVQCWGDNESGQLGNGTVTNSLSPVAVVGIDNAVQISAGRLHTCVATADGRAKCWGYNDDGQVGNGSRSWAVVTPVDVGLSDVVQVSAGKDHSCALLASGDLSCWGEDWAGQLGNGPDASDSASPTPVVGIGDVVDVAAGGSRTCAVTADGAMKCWGYFHDWEKYQSPTDVTGIDSAVGVTGEYWVTCAVLEDGTVPCWNGPNDAKVATPGFTDIVEVSGGSSSVCGLDSSAVVHCSYGRDHGTQLPGEVVTNLGSVESVSVGLSHMCAAEVVGSVRCWGSNSYGQFGNGTASADWTDVPVEVLGL